MEILKPKITVGTNAKVPDLLNYYSKGRMSLQELSDAFNKKVQWDYRGLDNLDPNWASSNTWATVHASLGKQIKTDEYMFLAQEYEKTKEAERIYE